VKLADDHGLDKDVPHQRVVGLEPGQADYRILIAEDHEASRNLLVKMLQDIGFVVRAAADGRQAIQIWEQWTPHLIWMDMRMPEMNGYEAVQYIRGKPQGQTTRIIALTATAFEEDREKIMLAGCDDFMRKPYHEADIFDMLTKYLNARFVYEEMAPHPASKIKAEEVFSPADLAELPDELIAELQQATTTADLNHMLGVIENISLHNPDMAAQLRELTHNFEYKQILTLIAESGDEK
jgi:CheY-like chemotaxis protein